jgi:hypothetical protein
MNFLNNTITEVTAFLKELCENKDYPTLSLLLDYLKEYENENPCSKALTQTIHELIKGNFELLACVDYKEEMELEYYSPYANPHKYCNQPFDLDWYYENQNYFVDFDYNVVTNFDDTESVEFEIFKVYLQYGNTYIDVTAHANTMSISDKLSDLHKYQLYEII